MSPKLVGMLHNLPRPYGKYYFALPEMSLTTLETTTINSVTESPKNSITHDSKKSCSKR